MQSQVMIKFKEKCWLFPFSFSFSSFSSYPSFKQGEPGDRGSPGPLVFYNENVRGEGILWGSGSTYVHRVLIQKKCL